jgi:hypothetical protein
MDILNTLFGCNHKHLSFPITLRSTAGANLRQGRSGTYVVCFDCGAELPYDWKEMKVVWKRKSARGTPAAATVPPRAA